MKKLQENFKIALDYFLYSPDKTLVIIQIYCLNPLYNFIEKSIEFIFKYLRIFLLNFLGNRKS